MQESSSGSYRFTNVDDKNIKKALKRIRKLSVCNSLAFWVSDITSKAIVSLATGLEKHSSLTALSFWDVNFGTKEMSALSELIQASKITELRISNNRQAIKGVAKLLSNNPALTLLDLSENRINKDEMEEIFRWLKENRTLTALGFSATNITDMVADKEITTDIEIKRLCEVLSDNQTLTSLDLLANNIGDEGMQSLCELLEKNHTLTTITLNFAGIVKDKQEKFKQLLATNRQNAGLLPMEDVKTPIGDLTAILNRTSSSLGYGEVLQQVLQNTIKRNMQAAQIKYIEDNSVLQLYYVLVRKSLMAFYFAGLTGGQNLLRTEVSKTEMVLLTLIGFTPFVGAFLSRATAYAMRSDKRKDLEDFAKIKAGPKEAETYFEEIARILTLTCAGRLIACAGHEDWKERVTKSAEDHAQTLFCKFVALDETERKNTHLATLIVDRDAVEEILKLEQPNVLHPSLSGVTSLTSTSTSEATTPTVSTAGSTNVTKALSEELAIERQKCQKIEADMGVMKKQLEEMKAQLAEEKKGKDDMSSQLEEMQKQFSAILTRLSSLDVTLAATSVNRAKESRFFSGGKNLDSSLSLSEKFEGASV